MNSYKEHAAVWDWDGFDNSDEYKYWCSYAEKFGNKVLIPMCALGQAGSYLAQRGFTVTGIDITNEMIHEGIKRYGHIKNLFLKVADICNMQLSEREFDFTFLSSQDLHLLADMNMVKNAFISIANHLRKGACLVLELILPSSESYNIPTQTYHPRVANYTDKKIWKEGQSRYDAITKRHYIDQIIFIDDGNNISSFKHSIILQYFELSDIIKTLCEANFKINGIFINRNREPWNEHENEIIIEALKM